MDLLKKIIKGFKLIKQGESLKDKLIIGAYFITRRLNLIGEVAIKTKEAKFFCGENIASVWAASDLDEEVQKMMPYFDINKGNFIDIGANIGKFSIIMGKRLGKNSKVFAIEPHPENFKILKKNIQLNKLSNVKAINAACSSSKRYLDLYLDEEGTGGHSIKKDAKSAGEKTIKVKSILLDSCKIKNVKLIKVDVEGAEADVLLGAKKILKRNHPKIIFEAWDEKYLNKIKKVLKPFKYKIKKIGKIDYFAY